MSAVEELKEVKEFLQDEAETAFAEAIALLYTAPEKVRDFAVKVLKG